MAKNELKLSDFQRNKENPFMKQAIEDIENHVVKNIRAVREVTKKQLLPLLIQIQEKCSELPLFDR